MGRALGGETTGLGQLDNIEGFFFLATRRARRHRTGTGRFLLEAGGGMFWEAECSYLAFIFVRVEQTLREG